MHPSRRRKKRPNYGIRAVEIVRGPNGFGFTISGQQPCILSCIVSNSPADQAGLRAGDFLISVNGISVSKITHDAVVNLIGNSVGPIKMTIAENYYSDSSDEDLDIGRIVNGRKPKYMHKTRVHRLHKNVDERVNNQDIANKRAIKAREVNADGVCFPVDDRVGPIEYKAVVGYLGTIEMPKQLLPNSRLQTVCSCIRKLRQEKRTPTDILMTILPTCLTLKNASNHILAIYPTNRVVYISATTDKASRYFGLVTSAVGENRTEDYLQEWQQETEKKCNNLDLEISNSCHVFVTEPKVADHNIHVKKAESFKITCTDDVVSGNCLEFPRNALSIVSLVQTMYHLQDPNEKVQSASKSDDNNQFPLMANSPQPSASSNSDSGIGFRDDCGNVSDRILIVEFPAHRTFPVDIPNNKHPAAVDASIVSLETLDFPLNNRNMSGSNLNNIRSNVRYSSSNNLLKEQVNLNNIRAYETVSIKNAIEKPDSDYLMKQNNTPESEHCNVDGVKRLTVRAMPDPCISKSNAQENKDLEVHHIFSERAIDVPADSPSKKSCESISLHSVNDDLSDYKGSVDNISMHSLKSIESTNLKTIFKTPKYLENKRIFKRQLKMVSSCDSLVQTKSEDNFKLSPKVYGVCKPNYSCEELSNLENEEKCGYGSLQNLHSWNGKCEKRNITFSEPDVRLQTTRTDQFMGCGCMYNRESNSMVVAFRPPFKRFNNSLRRAGSARCFGRRPISLLAASDITSQCEKNEEVKCNSEGAAEWAVSFEKLLDDPLGLHTFAEFLKKEFSAENIYFWTACERYKRVPSDADRAVEAQRIYQQHLCIGAPEPVNVDSQGRQCAEQSLQEADPTLFDQAQKQIFNLMKFDSYPRFLKSELYKQCLSGNISGPHLDSSLLLQPVVSTPSKLKKSLSNAEDRRRKSLLPWHRKNRSKSKDRGESEYNHRKGEGSLEDGSSSQSIKGNDVYSSKSSLTSLDLAITSSMQESMNGSRDELSTARSLLCRVMLNNGTTTIVQIRQTETIQQFIARLLEKRGLKYNAFEVFTDKHHKALDVSESSAKLAGCEVTVEQRVVFKLDLPNRKVIAVKSKYTKILVDVLRPILHKYNYVLEQVRITIDGNRNVDVYLPVTSVDGRRLNIQLLEVLDHKEEFKIPSSAMCTMKMNHTLDEITNKVYEDILQGKSDAACTKQKSDKGSVKSEDWGSEHSSGIFGRFLRRDSAIHERKKKGMAYRKASVVNFEESTSEQNSACKKPLIAKWKAGVKLQVACSESDELYEGLSRAQRSRLEDQRGTEINFELPDFLKDKENEHCKDHLQMESFPGNSKFYVREDNPHSKLEAVSTKSVNSVDLPNNYENAVINNEYILKSNHYGQQNKVQQLIVNNLRIYSPLKSEESSSSQSSPSKSSSFDNTVIENKNLNESQNSMKSYGSPPPLPPKPKVLPARPSNWGHTGYFKVPSIPNKQTLYLEPSSSSFV